MAICNKNAPSNSPEDFPYVVPALVSCRFIDLNVVHQRVDGFRTDYDDYQLLARLPTTRDLNYSFAELPNYPRPW